jgi:hypothetical protein
MSSNPFLSKEVNFKRVRKGFAIAFPVVIMILVIGTYYVNLIDYTLREKYKTEKIVYVEKGKVELEGKDGVLGEENIIEEEITTVIGIDEIKKRLLTLIPEKYEVIEAEYNFPGIYDDECISLYYLFPKDYSISEREYLDTAYIQYCKDINTATLGSQIGEVRYDRKEDAWFFYEGQDRFSGPSEEMRIYGDNIVTITEVWGSHHSWDAYIVKLDNSDEVIILEIPQATRVRCEEYDENGTETWKEDCVEFLKSFGFPPSGNAWIFHEAYDDDYWDLIEILKDI